MKVKLEVVINEAARELGWSRGEVDVRVTFSLDAVKGEAVVGAMNAATDHVRRVLAESPVRR